MTVQNVGLALVRPNPYRDLKTYPWIEPKVEALMRSIKDVGFWESVIARKNGGQFEVAFGHHRIEAAKRLKLSTVPLIIRKLSDEDMLKFMGRENGEDYHTEFLIMLNTWESAIRYTVASLPTGRREKIESVTINLARLLGWVSLKDESNQLARTCANAMDLIAGEHITRDDLKGLSCIAARELLAATQAQIQSIKKHQKPEEQEKQISAVKETAKKSADQIRQGNVAVKNIRGTVDSIGYGKRFRTLPNFYRYAQDLIEMIGAMLKDDAASTRIEAIIEALPLLFKEGDVNGINLDVDRVNVLCLRLDELSQRCNDYKKQIQGTYSKKTRRLEIVR